MTKHLVTLFDSNPQITREGVDLQHAEFFAKVMLA